MYRSGKAIRRLPVTGDLEIGVLEHLWQQGEADVAEAHAAVGERRRITPNTVGSALERLYKKGLVTRRKVSHAYRYSPALSREQYAAMRVLEAAGGASALGETGVLSAFVDLVSSVDEAALDRLEALIAEKRDERGKP